jgi:hypothetical protein
MPREWVTETRAPWCPLIHQLLQAIDRHNQLYFVTRDTWHLRQAMILRHYVSELKTWIVSHERASDNEPP